MENYPDLRFCHSWRSTLNAARDQALLIEILSGKTFKIAITANPRVELKDGETPDATLVLEGTYQFSQPGTPISLTVTKHELMINEHLEAHYAHERAQDEDVEDEMYPFVSSDKRKFDRNGNLYFVTVF